MRSGIYPPGAGCSSSCPAWPPAWLCYFHALQIGQASRVIPIDKFSVVISMVLAFVVLREAVTVQTVIGGLLITAGTLVLIL